MLGELGSGLYIMIHYVELFNLFCTRLSAQKKDQHVKNGERNKKNSPRGNYSSPNIKEWNLFIKQKAIVLHIKRIKSQEHKFS